MESSTRLRIVNGDAALLRKKGTKRGRPKGSGAFVPGLGFVPGISELDPEEGFTGFMVVGTRERDVARRSGAQSLQARFEALNSTVWPGAFFKSEGPSRGASPNGGVAWLCNCNETYGHGLDAFDSAWAEPGDEEESSSSSSRPACPEHGRKYEQCGCGVSVFDGYSVCYGHRGSVVDQTSVQGLSKAPEIDAPPLSPLSDAFPSMKNDCRGWVGAFLQNRKAPAVRRTETVAWSVLTEEQLACRSIVISLWGAVSTPKVRGYRSGAYMATARKESAE